VDRHPDSLLAGDERAHEKVDQDVALTWTERVLPELDDA
jgi:hypothetical protein